jgi:sRNA-binding carbon storage regulator CsrA
MALSLGRKQGEKVVIRTPEGRTITVTVAQISNDNKRVRLAFTAEKEVRIDREEIHELRQRGS